MRLTLTVAISAALALSVSGAQATEREKAAALVAEGVELHDAGDYAGAIAKYQEALAIEPEDPLATCELMHTYMVMGDPQACIELGVPAINRTVPLELAPMMYTIVGSCYSGLELFNQALEMFERGLSIAPADRLLNFNKAVALLRFGSVEQGIAHMTRVARMYPDYASPYYINGAANAEHGRRVPAILWLSRFITLEPNSERSYAASATILELMTRGVDKEGDDRINITIDPGEMDEGPWGAASFLLSATAALMHDDEKADMSEAARTVEALTTFLTFLDETEPDPSVAELWILTARPLLTLDQSERETLAYLIALRANVEGAREWMTENEGRLGALEIAIANMLPRDTPDETESESVAEGERSSPDDLAMAVRIARFLEQRPLDEKAKPLREQLTKWLVIAPDVVVRVCFGFFPGIDGTRNYAHELLVQSMYSQAAFIIENPERAENINDAYLAGVEGTLRAYEAIRAEKPKVRWRVLDDLIRMREAGTLAEWVSAKALEECSETTD